MQTMEASTAAIRRFFQKNILSQDVEAGRISISQ